MVLMLLLPREQCSATPEVTLSSAWLRSEGQVPPFFPLCSGLSISGADWVESTQCWVALK